MLKIENNYIYFTDNVYGVEGYIANKSKITIVYKYKIQPGLLAQEHFLMVIYPWTNIFENTFKIIINSLPQIKYKLI